MSAVPRLYCDKFGGNAFPRNFHSIKPLKKVKKNEWKVASIENSSSKKMSTRPRLYYEGFGSQYFPNNFYLIKPLKEVEKINKNIASPENSSTKKISTGSSLYYYGYDGHDCQKKNFYQSKNFLRTSKINLKNNSFSREFDNEENKLLTKSVL